MNKKNLAVIASRLKCVDAVSVEADKWIDKYLKLGYNVHLIAGKFGEPVKLPCFELPEMDYKHPEVRGVNRIMFSSKLEKEGRKAAEILLNSLVKRIKSPLKNYLIQNKIEILCIEDALVSLKNLPLNIAVSQIVYETGLPTISRYHYLEFDHPYFNRFDNFPKIIANIPAKHKNIIHITSTQNAHSKLNESRKIFSQIIPNTIDLDKIQEVDNYNSDLRREFGIMDDAILFLQPTRLKRNKFVERSIKLVAEINDITKKENVLVITGSPVYSRGNYFEEIVRKMGKQNVKVVFANDRVFLGRYENQQKKFYSIHDVYAHADVVLYPSDSDAFGNPVIEAAAYRKPVVVNAFPNIKNFQDKGFSLVVMDQKIDPGVVSDTYELIANKDKTKEAVENNFELLKKFYSSDLLDDKLIPILNKIDEQKSFISRVTELIPGSFWRSSAVDKSKTVKTKKSRTRKDSRPDLKNRKGGYKEPAK